MDVVLISPHGNLANFGLRVLSACLIQAGHNTRLIFLPDAKERLSFLLFEPRKLYSVSTVRQVVELCSGADLIGITVMTNYFFRAKQLTDSLHEQLHIPIIWGGVHPTVCPEECLEHADIICVGEGEQALVELANRLAKGEPLLDTANLWYKSIDGQVIKNRLRPLVQDLDALPFPDFGLDNHYILHKGQIQLLTPALLNFYLMSLSVTGNPVYPLLASRGCPHCCSYCANDTYARLYQGWRHMRRRSAESLVVEIQSVREQFPFIKEIAFLDDVFVAASTETIESFSCLYKEKVGLPFYCIISPSTINEVKLEALLDAGLVKVFMGIETGSRRLQQLYKRPADNATVLKAAHLIHRYTDRMLPPTYDIITDSLYEEYQDRLATLKLLQRIPYPYSLLIFSLVCYPGTILYKQAIVDDLIKNEREEIHNRNYLKVRSTFYNLILYGFHYQLPHWFLSLMSHKLLSRLLNIAQMRPLWILIGRWLNQRQIRHSKRKLENLQDRFIEWERFYLTSQTQSNGF